MGKKLMVSVAVTACIALSLGLWATAGSHAKVGYRTAPAGRGDISVAISATGSPNAVVTVQVGSQVSGTVMQLLADFNTKVSKGQLIALIDPAPFQAKVDQAQASRDSALASGANAQAVVQQAMAGIQAATSSLAAAHANVQKSEAILQDAKSKVERRVIMVQKGADSTEDLETAQTAYKSAVADHNALIAQEQSAEDGLKVAQAQLSVARSLLAVNQAQQNQALAALRAAQLDLDHTRIAAPVDGVVVSRNVDAGQTVAASLSAPTLFLIAQDLTKMQVDTNVSEADIGRIRVDQDATFTVDAYPGQAFHGKVTSIRKAPMNVQNVITYDAVVSVANPDLKLFPGMTANVKILVKQRSGVLWVPNAALRFRPSAEPASAGRGPRGGAGRAVWVLGRDGEARKVAVTTGETDGINTEILAGDLKEGDVTITAALTQTSLSNASLTKWSASSTASPAAQGMGRGTGF